MPQPGWKSSEFWLTAASHVSALLVLFGLVPQEAARQDTVGSALTGIFALITILGTTWRYMDSRRHVKVEQIKQNGTRGDGI